MGHGSELHGTLNTVTHHTNSVKKEQTHYFGKSQLKQGSKAPDHRPTVAMLQLLKPSAGAKWLFGDLVGAAFQVKLKSRSLQPTFNMLLTCNMKKGQ